MLSKLSDNRWVILGVSYLVIVGAALPYFGWAPGLIPIATELQLDYAQAGTLVSVTALAGGIALILGGPLVVRLGPKNVILGALVLAIIGQVLFAQADGYSPAMVARAVSGVAVGLLVVAPYTMAISWFLESRQVGRATGAMLSGDGIGVLFALVLFAAVLASVGWRDGLLWQAGYLALLFVLALVLLKNPPAPADAPGQGAGQPQSSALRAFLGAIRNRNVLFAMAFYVGGWGLFALIASWMPTILVEAGWSETAAGLFSSFTSLFGIITAVSFGLLSDEFAGRRKRMIIVAGLSVTASVGLLTAAIAAGNYTLAALALPLIGLAGYAGAALSLSLANESVDGEHVGAVNGLVLGGAFLVGGLVYPYVLGSVRDATGSFATGFLVVTIATFVLCVLAQLFGRDVGKAVLSPIPLKAEASAAEAF